MTTTVPTPEQWFPCCEHCGDKQRGYGHNKPCKECQMISTQECSLCGHSYPNPVELHHAEDECRENQTPTPDPAGEGDGLARLAQVISTFFYECMGGLAADSPEPNDGDLNLAGAILVAGYLSPDRAAAAVRAAKAEALRDAADDLLRFCHQSAHEQVCANQQRSDRTSAQVALDVAADWLRVCADTIAATEG